MKKLVNIISLLSLVSIISLIALSIYANNSGLFERFIVEWIFTPLRFLSIPLVGRVFSLAYNKDKIQPRTWLGIYGVVMTLMIAIWFIFNSNSFIAKTKDLKSALRHEYLTVEGEVNSVYFVDSKKLQKCSVNNLDFTINNTYFLVIHQGKRYTFNYLEYSGYLVDIYDENGKSLKK